MDRETTEAYEEVLTSIFRSALALTGFDKLPALHFVVADFSLSQASEVCVI